MPMKPWILSFLLSLGGVISDYVTTSIGLSLGGFYETQPGYHPLYALLIFWGSIAIMNLALPRKKPWTIGVNGVALTSYLGTVNNILVILGLFSGLRI